MTREEAPTENTNTPTNTPNDLISRQAAIGACAYETIECYEARKTIRNLPSEGQNCILCEYYTEIETDDGIKGKCTRRTGSDLISRQDAIDAFTNFIWVDYPTRELAQESVEMVMGQVPSAEPKIGEWIQNDNGTYSCSVCHSWIPEEQHHYARFCLYCGSDMRGEEE